MRTGVPSGFSGAALNGFIAVELMFDSGTVRLWDGYRDLTVGGNVYTGAGTLLSVSQISEDAEISAKGISVKLSAIDATILSYALTENYTYRPMSVYVGTVDGAVVYSYKVFSGRMDVMSIVENGETAEVSLTGESRLIDLERPRVRRWTSEDQKSLYGGDLGFDFLNSIQEKEIVWKG